MYLPTIERKSSKIALFIFECFILNFFFNNKICHGQQNGENSINSNTNIKKHFDYYNVNLNAKSTINSSLLNNNNDNNQIVKVQYVNVNGLPVLVQFTYTGPPKILPIATADSYPEGSSINLICTVSGGERKGLELSWKLNGDELNEQKLKYSKLFNDNVSIGKDDADISILRIKNATNSNSGVYTCTAQNRLGQDSTSVKIVINVELKWNKISKDIIEVGLNQEILIDCDAIGIPEPVVEFIKHSDNSNRNQNGTIVVSRGKQFKINRAQLKDSGLYECRAKNNVDQDLRKIIQVKVRE